MKYLLDTNIFREIGKTEPDENVAAWLNGVDDSDLAISALTVREVRKGIEKLRARKPAIAGQIEARVSVAFDAFGERITPVTREVEDTGIAATARVYGLILVTRNLKDIAGRGVRALDPFKPQHPAP